MRLLSALLLLGLFGVPALAAESPPVISERATATLISDTDQVQAGVPFRVGLRLRLAPGWHTYWRNPGDAGAAPEIQIDAPEGMEVGPILWPAPTRLVEGPLMSFAYQGEVVLPVTLTPGPAAPSGPLTIAAKASWLVCQKVCVPEEGSFTLRLAPGTPAPSAQAPLFAQADERMPRPSPYDATITQDGELVLTGADLSARTVSDAWFFPEEPGVIDHAARQRVTVGAGEVRIGVARAPQARPGTGLRGVVVLRDPSGRERALSVEAAPRAASGPGGGGALLPIGLAYVGGLILNLMPCVFPILAMKAVSLARLSAKERWTARRHAASYAAGVIAAFLGLASALLALRAGGAEVGWGFQFQSPLFVTVMAWVLLAVGLNLSGLYEVRFSLSAGPTAAAGGSYMGDFLTGLLAVVVATPCTAPFMGVAVASALAAPPWRTMLVFAALGAGLATPYVLLASVPVLARHLPRPGRWMGTLRSVLAFPMYGAAAWLVWVASLQSGPTAVLVTAGGMVLLGFALWCCGLAQAARSAGGRRAGLAVAAVALLLTLATLSGLGGASSGQALAATSGAEPYSAERLAALRAEGRPVFVNMTAAWCVTCLLNERLALSPGAVRDAFARNNVAYLKGDWTRADPAITAFLQRYHRDGVPLYVFYPPGDGPPQVLPQILTQADILAQIDQRGG